jgi:hypothetical protein
MYASSRGNTLKVWDDELLYIDLIYNCESKETDAIETGSIHYYSHYSTIPFGD